MQGLQRLKRARRLGVAPRTRNGACQVSQITLSAGPADRAAAPAVRLSPSLAPETARAAPPVPASSHEIAGRSLQPAPYRPVTSARSIAPTVARCGSVRLAVPGVLVSNPCPSFTPNTSVWFASSIIQTSTPNSCTSTMPRAPIWRPQGDPTMRPSIWCEPACELATRPTRRSAAIQRICRAPISAF